MEIGSFIELQFYKGKEFYNQDIDIARLNTGRAAIWHAFRMTGCKGYGSHIINVIQCVKHCWNMGWK